MFQTWMQMVLLAAESQQVIGLRMMRLSRGGRIADREARRMVEEKIAASLAASAKLMIGGSSDSVIADYRKLVRANNKRLTKRR